MQWTTACPDWQRRIVNRESLIPFDPLFPDEAAASLATMEQLRVVDMPGSPTFGEVSRPWVREFVSSVFGAYDAESGRRLISEFLLLISKKNWKSGLAASLMLTVLIRNWRKSAEFLILAPTVEVANNSFYPARDMVREDPELSDIFHVQDHVRTITHRRNGAMLKVVAADSEAVSGKKATAVLVDELWLFGKKKGAENMLREATGGLISRPEGFVIYLTTQSDEPPEGVFRSKLTYARKVRDGVVEDKRFMPILYEFPRVMIEEKAYLDPKNFHITNPNLGKSVDQEWLERELSKAINGEGEESIQGFVAKHLNVEIGLNLMSDRWAGADFWLQCADNDLTLDEVLRRSEVVIIGIDGGGLNDLFGMAVLGRDAKTKEWLHWGHAWMHPIALERNKQNAEKYKDFAAQGDLTIVDNVNEDIDQIIDVVIRCEDSGLLGDIAVDVYALGKLDERLQFARENGGAGIDKDRIIGISQGWKLMTAIKEAERAVAAMSIKHGGRPLMAWCVGNAKVEPKGNAIAITKQGSGNAKIDPLIALFNAVQLMSLNPEPRNQYVTEELTVL